MTGTDRMLARGKVASISGDRHIRIFHYRDSAFCRVAAFLKFWTVYNHGRRLSIEDAPVVWRNTSVLRILDNYAYACHTVSCRSESVS